MTGGGGSDDGSDGGSERLDVANVPFTFVVAEELVPVEAEKLPPGFFAIVGLTPLDYVDVRLTAYEELDDDAIDARLRSTLTPSQEILGRDQFRADATTFSTWQVADHAGGANTLSRLNFVRIDGETWEIGCQSRVEYRREMDRACDQALQTFAPRSAPGSTAPARRVG